RKLGAIDLEGWALANLASWRVEVGDLDGAAGELAAGLEKLAAAEDAMAAAAAIDTAAVILACRSRFADAALAWGAYEAAIADMGVPRDRLSTAEAAVADAQARSGSPSSSVSAPPARHCHSRMRSRSSCPAYVNP
ncbi:MAG: hypothetical protein H0W81_10885, partial [Chloroflexi bacterium]|nr:hypothetical protein [Chloroflexota bacterium]